jgi:hypothetical protein
VIESPKEAIVSSGETTAAVLPHCSRFSLPIALRAIGKRRGSQAAPKAEGRVNGPYEVTEAEGTGVGGGAVEGAVTSS